MDITKYKTLIIDCDGILVNHFHGILTKLYELQQNLPQDISYQTNLIQRYLDHYYHLSDALDQNGFCASHCFTFQSLMKQDQQNQDWRMTFRFGRTIKHWPLYEDAYGALHYLKKFFRVFIRCDREPEDIPYLIENLGITQKDLIIRGSQANDLHNVLATQGHDIESALLLTTPHLAHMTSFPNTRVIHRYRIPSSDQPTGESLADLVIEHQNILRNSWH
ncbi:hypothetical protein VA7868_04129 [Vibrio aerogenes CECT 7868]|uniref:Haloacid dehalogenase-like hydrolase n=1 Tax=Vibrio aerogenes CECT 7868 TaxID=1216006 RepID=A0A1M6D450_9VIBR|nr:hypothetical protein [Vibrio aerogenes]SHI67863.1 hypothetical protein VA7868_04129 [Vibrio aerogenes CECT 7868]